MKYNRAQGANLSVFSLGTVQLGMNYGVNNTQGKPSMEQAREILDATLTLGVNSLDTAIGYGDSERVIGEWLKNVPDDRRPMVVTKVDVMDHASPKALRDSVRKSMETSRKRLGLERIPLLMIHDYDNYAKNPEEVDRVFEELRASGEIERWGISAYSRHDYQLLADSTADAVQIPQNIFDWTQIQNGGLEALAKSGKIVFVRSVFLQGLVFMDPDSLRPEMAFAAPSLRRFREFCEEFGLAPEVLAASFVLSLPGVTSLVLGCERREQAKANAALMDKTVRLTDGQMNRLREAFERVDPHLIDPGTWYNSGR